MGTPQENRLLDETFDDFMCEDLSCGIQLFLLVWRMAEPAPGRGPSPYFRDSCDVPLARGLPRKDEASVSESRDQSP